MVESVSKLIATGASFEDVYLTFQEYFEKPGRDPKRWGQPAAALLGAFAAQMDLGVAAIGGKDSMSGSFEDLDVPPTLVSFAVTTGKTGEIISPELKEAGHSVRWLRPAYLQNGLPDPESLKTLFHTVKALMESGKVAAAYTPTAGGVAEAVFKMAMGNGLGFIYEAGLTLSDLFTPHFGSFILELSGDVQAGVLLGKITEEPVLTFGGETVSMEALLSKYLGKLEPVYPTHAKESRDIPETFSAPATERLAPKILCPKPQVLIPVFPGTNCEYDTARAMEDAGAKAKIFVVQNRTASDIAKSVEDFSRLIGESQMIFLPGGFSAGDEPDGSGKFITAFFRGEAVKEAVQALLEERDGLMAGICNGFQALIKLGLVPYGRITEPDEKAPTLTFNAIGRHQSRLVRTRIASNRSPWLSKTKVGEIYTVPISHGEGRFLASDEVVAALAKNGQIATQYVDLDGKPTYDIAFNPNNSVRAIEGITSPDGGSSARWDTRSASARDSTKTSPASLKWACSKARWSISSNQGAWRRGRCLHRPDRVSGQRPPGGCGHPPLRTNPRAVQASPWCPRGGGTAKLCRRGSEPATTPQSRFASQLPFTGEPISHFDKEESLWRTFIPNLPTPSASISWCRATRGLTAFPPMSL